MDSPPISVSSYSPLVNYGSGARKWDLSKELCGLQNFTGTSKPSHRHYNLRLTLAQCQKQLPCVFVRAQRTRSSQPPGSFYGTFRAVASGLSRFVLGRVTIS